MLILKCYFTIMKPRCLSCLIRCARKVRLVKVPQTGPPSSVKGSDAPNSKHWQSDVLKSVKCAGVWLE